MSKLGWIGLSALLILGKPLQAEVDQVQIRWNAFKCQETCIPLIQKSLQTIPQVSNIQTNASEGTATMNWNPNYPFNYDSFRVASSTAGIRFNEISLQVKGMVSHDTQNFYLTSYGDNTRFSIIGPPQIEPGRSTPRFNVATRPLEGQAKEQLLEAERNKWMVSISGPLYLPHSSSNLTLMAQHIKIFVPEGSQ